MSLHPSFIGLSITERFMQYVARRGRDRCWIWFGARDKGSRYGIFNINHKRWWAHRVAAVLLCGEDPAGLVVMHSCDNPPCVNPRHLMVGSHQDNSNDKMRKQRHGGPGGEAHKNAKLTDSDVAEIRQLRRDGLSCRAIAKMFGVNHGHVSRVANGISRGQWRWLGKRQEKP